MKGLVLFFSLIALCLCANEIDYVLRYTGTVAVGPSPGVYIGRGKAGSQDFTTLIDAQDGFDMIFGQSLGPKSVLTSILVVAPDGSHFSETGNITFAAEKEDNHLIYFDTLLNGTMIEIDTFIIHGLIVLEVTGGYGAFKGASGAITSNFVYNATSSTFVDNQYGTLWLP